MYSHWIKTVAGVMLVVLLLPACHKTVSPTPPTKRELLTTLTWKMTQIVWDGHDDTGDYEPCELDNLFVFQTDGQYIIREGATRCLPTDNDIYDRGEWTLSENDTRLIMTFKGIFEVVELTSGRLKLKSVDGFGKVAWLTYTAQ